MPLVAAIMCAFGVSQLSYSHSVGLKRYNGAAPNQLAACIASSALLILQTHSARTMAPKERQDLERLHIFRSLAKGA